MAFDIISWVVGFALTKSATKFIEKASLKSLSKELNSVAVKWAEGLPPEISVNPSSLFKILSPSIESDNKSLIELRADILNKKLPKLDTWINAIFFQWNKIKQTYGEGAQNFYQLDEDTALKHIKVLSERLHQKCVEDTLVFQNEVLNELKLLKAKIEALSSINNTDSGQTPLSIIIDLENCVEIYETFWPLMPCLSKDPEAYNDIYEIIENVIDTIHHSYNLINPFLKDEENKELSKQVRRSFVSSLNYYLLVVDAFYYSDLEETLRVLERQSDNLEVEKHTMKWIVLILFAIKSIKDEEQNK